MSDNPVFVLPDMDFSTIRPKGMAIDTATLTKIQEILAKFREIGDAVVIDSKYRTYGGQIDSDVLAELMKVKEYGPDDTDSKQAANERANKAFIAELNRKAQRGRRK